MKNKNMSSYPVVAVGGVLFHENRVLLVKRSKKPAQGLWAIPGGKIKTGESLAEALGREFKEETGLEIEVGKVVYVFDAIDLPHYHYVIIDYAVFMKSGTLMAGDDAEEARWFAREELEKFPVAPATKDLLARYSTFSHVE